MNLSRKQQEDFWILASHLLLILLLLTNTAYAKNLEKTEEEAYNFGLKIQKFVREKDLKGFFSLTPKGELENGPRKKNIESKSFNDIFSDEWRKKVLDDPPPRSPVGYRGYMLGRGLIWYRKEQKCTNLLSFKPCWTEFQIIAINGFNEEKLDNDHLPTYWKLNNKTLPAQCFTHKWLSLDNYEAFERKFSITNPADFRKNPGKYFGKEISSLVPIRPDWSMDNSETVSLANFVDECSNYKSNELNYKVLARIPEQECKTLAPHLAGRCLGSFLLNISINSGGSMGPSNQFNVYGLFELEGKSKVIVPLKNFYSINSAMNYLDTI